MHSNHGEGSFVVTFDVQFGLLCFKTGKSKDHLNLDVIRATIDTEL